MHDGEPHPGQRHVGPFGQPGAQLVAIVVAPARDQALGAALQGVECRDVDPVPGVHDDVGVLDRRPNLRGQVFGALGQVGVGDEEEFHWPPWCPNGKANGTGVMIGGDISLQERIWPDKSHSSTTSSWAMNRT